MYVIYRLKYFLPGSKVFVIQLCFVGVLPTDGRGGHCGCGVSGGMVDIG